MTPIGIKALIQSRGLTQKDIGMAFAKIYICKEHGGDPHAAFGLELDVTRNEAKQICFWFQYQNDFMRYLFKEGQSLAYDQSIRWSNRSLLSMIEQKKQQVELLHRVVFEPTNL